MSDKINLNSLSQIIKDEIDKFDHKIDTASVGQVVSIGDNIATIYGLDEAMYGELIEFPNNTFGIVMNIEEDSLGVAIFEGDAEIKEGDICHRTNRVVSVPVGEINATSHIDSFLSDSAEISGGNVDNIIFSYRLVASDDVTYNIKFSITPFIEQNTIDVSSASIIDAAFKTDHHNIVYSDGKLASGFTVVKVTDPENTADGNPSDTSDLSTNQSHKEAVLLEDSIKPKEGNSSQWIFRGAVLMAVSRRDFDRAPTGMYKSTVTATLTTD